MKKRDFAIPPMLFGDVGAKRSQDNKPSRVMEEPVRTASVVDALWSQPSLRSRLGMELSQAWPLLSRLCSAPLIPARPFGLGLRFDEALLVAPISSVPEVSSQPTEQECRTTSVPVYQEHLSFG
jgi:hypothetical protein